MTNGTLVSSFRRRIQPAVQAELEASDRLESSNKVADSFRHLERAHVLGQASTVLHVQVHVRMLVWAWRRKNLREFTGQLLRVLGAATKTGFGWVPIGNTGGANVSPIRPMPIPDDLKLAIDRARPGP